MMYEHKIDVIISDFGPSLVGVLRDWAGNYGPALGACASLQAVAAVMILLGPGRERATR